MSCAEGCCNTVSTAPAIPLAQSEVVARAQYRAEGRVYEREAIAQQLKNLPAEALFYPANILKLLKLD